MIRSLTFHIGDFKTGTTAIQRFLTTPQANISAYGPLCPIATRLPILFKTHRLHHWRLRNWPKGLRTDMGMRWCHLSILSRSTREDCGV